MTDPVLARLLALPRPLLVVAHPGSGTQFLCERIREAGVSAAHERLPGENEALPDVTVSWRYWPWRTAFPAFRGRVALIRDPMPTVFSAGALFSKRPDVQMDVAAQFSPGLIRADYLAALHTLAVFFARVDTLDWEIFRIERFAIPEGARLNSHRKLEGSWSNLAGRCTSREDSICFASLAETARRHGYDSPAAKVA